MGSYSFGMKTSLQHTEGEEGASQTAGIRPLSTALS